MSNRRSNLAVVAAPRAIALELLPRDPEPISLIDAYIAQQRELTAVQLFSRYHEQHQVPAQAKYYRDLIPLTEPRAGQQYAFEVDLDACSGCKACVSACHTLNGLDEDETWRSVGLLIGNEIEAPFVQHTTAACHHCLEPACMDGCPVLAYEKDEVTGIVRHLSDQCIGCQYCTLKCPYDVPKYSKQRGIVRKCDMCSSRLSVGEAPACVQACPSSAIRIRIIDKDKLVQDITGGDQFLSGAHDPTYTLPTTRYNSKQPLPVNALSADHFQLRPQHAHWSLIVMLVLSQLSVGAFAVGQLSGASPSRIHTTTALGLGIIALISSLFHLGRPQYAYRAVLGLRRSWLSREVVAFGLFANLAIAHTLCSWFWPQSFHWLGASVVIIGLMGVFCSAMIYHDTRRDFWHLRYTGVKFFLSTLLLGATLSLLTGAVVTSTVPLSIIAVTGAMKIGLELLVLRYLKDDLLTPMKRSALLLLGPLRAATAWRIVLGSVALILLPLIGIAPSLAILVFIAVLAAEFFERYLFFTAVVAPKMPGGLGA